MLILFKSFCLQLLICLFLGLLWFGTLHAFLRKSKDFFIDYRGKTMTTTTMKLKAQGSVKPLSRNGKTPELKKRGRGEKNSPWMAIVIFLIFAGLVAYMFSPNVPNSQRSGSQTSATTGFANSLAK
jgi:hypothetical protein